MGGSKFKDIMLAEEGGWGSRMLHVGDSVGWGSKSGTSKVGWGSEELAWLVTVKP